jgi:hypothetical protein
MGRNISNIVDSPIAHVNSHQTYPGAIHMIALEIEAPIINHRIEVSSDRLPANAARARVIVLFEGDAAGYEESSAGRGPLAEFRAHPIKVKSFEPLTRDEANAR